MNLKKIKKIKKMYKDQNLIKENHQEFMVVRNLVLIIIHFQKGFKKVFIMNDKFYSLS